MTKKKEEVKAAEQFFYEVRFLNGVCAQVTADDYNSHGLALVSDQQDAWLIFYNRGDEVFRHRISRLAGWSRMAKPGVTA